MSRASTRERRRRRGGFTLVEVLVALAVAAACLGAIALVTGTSARAVRALERRVALVQTTRAVETGIPKRKDLAIGRLDGELANHRWRMDVRPLEVGELPAEARWVPRNILVRVRSPSGSVMMVETVRLVPRGAE